MIAFTDFNVFIYLEFLPVTVNDPVHDLFFIPATSNTEAIFIISADQFARAGDWHTFSLLNSCA
jgi:hypothetical protein